MRVVARVAGALGALVACSLVTVPGAAATTLGKQRILVALVSYTSVPFPRSSVTDAVSSAGAFLRRSSFGKVTLQATITPWLAGGPTMPSCGASADQTFAPLREVAADAGFDPGGFDEAIYVVAGERCGFEGIERGKEVLIVREPDERLVVHELGHTFGLAHAAAAGVCTSLCVTQEQGDIYDPMGSGFADFSAYEKEQLGWLPRQPRVTRPGRYTVYPVRAASVSRQALVIETLEGEYWLEPRPGARTPGLIVRVVHPELPSSWPIPPSMLLLAPIRAGHPVIARGQTFRLSGAFTVAVGRTRGDQLRLNLKLAGVTR